MQKKLLAAAVAGIFAAPAVVMAQSTVQVYGRINLEYGFLDQGNGREDVDIMQTPGSNVGFKGEEKLGGGLSAWFQCESSADVRGETDGTAGFCSRNSAIGLKGGFGNVFIGTWDTPFKRAANPATVGSGDTGLFGSAFLLFGSSTTVSESAGAGAASGSAVALNRTTWKRRQRNSINYHSPSFGGFKFEAAMSSTNGSTSLTSAAAADKPRVWSVAAQYKNGPLYIGGGYESHENFGSTAAANTTDDKAYHLGAAYKFAGKFEVGFLFTEQEFDQGAAGDYKRQAWSLGLEADLGGPHAIHASYVEADDADGAPGLATPGSPFPSIPAAGGATGAKLYQVKYVHSLSKRTKLYGGYSKVSNDAFANYGLGGAKAPNLGQDQDAFVIGVDHRF